MQRPVAPSNFTAFCFITEARIIYGSTLNAVHWFHMVLLLCCSVLSLWVLSASSFDSAALSIIHLTFVFHCVRKWTCGMRACEKFQLRESQGQCVRVGSPEIVSFKGAVGQIVFFTF